MEFEIWCEDSNGNDRLAKEFDARRDDVLEVIISKYAKDIRSMLLRQIDVNPEQSKAIDKAIHYTLRYIERDSDIVSDFLMSLVDDYGKEDIARELANIYGY